MAVFSELQVFLPPEEVLSAGHLEEYMLKYTYTCVKQVWLHIWDPEATTIFQSIMIYKWMISTNRAVKQQHLFFLLCCLYYSTGFSFGFIQQILIKDNWYTTSSLLLAKPTVALIFCLILLTSDASANNYTVAFI